MHPPEKLEMNTNPSISNLPKTQQAASSSGSNPPKNEFQELQKLIMLFPSIVFTRTMVTMIKSTFYHIYHKIHLLFSYTLFPS